MSPTPSFANGNTWPRLTTQMLGNSLNKGSGSTSAPSIAGTDCWVFVDTLYPQLKYFAGTDVSVASVTPVLLPVTATDTMTVTSVSENFVVCRENNVEWGKISGSGLNLVGDSAILDGNPGLVVLQDSINGVGYKKVRIFLTSKPLVIKNLTELCNFRDGINSGDIFFYRMADSTFTLADKTDSIGYMEIPPGGEDINFLLMTNTYDMSSIANWVPIGDETSSFKGFFNGNNNTIENMTIDTAANYLGLFGYSYGTIDSLTMVNATITEKALNSVGAVCGYSYGNITHCSSINGDILGRGSVGGIVGQCYGGKLTDCHHSHGRVSITANASYVGGIMGYGTLVGVRNCSIDSSDISGWGYVGGIFGYNNSATMYNCHTKGGSVSTKYVTSKTVGNYIGGLFGYFANGYSTPSVSYLYNEQTLVNDTIQVTTSRVVAGLGAYLQWGTAHHCYNTALVHGYAGTLSGLFWYTPGSGWVNNSFNSGDVIADHTSSSAAGINQYGATNCMNIGNLKAGSVYGICTRYSRNRCINAGSLTATSSEAYGLGGGMTTSEMQDNYDCLNAGEVISKGNAAGIGPMMSSYRCLNVGRISGYANVGGISASYQSYHSFSDEQMAPSSHYRDNSTALQTSEMVGDQLKSELGETHWIYEDNMYPRLKWTDTLTWLDGTPFPYVRDAAILASTPIYMKANEHVNNFSTTMALKHSTDNGVTWGLKEGSGIVVGSDTARKIRFGVSYLQSWRPTNNNDTLYLVRRILTISDSTPVVIKSLTDLKSFRDCINGGKEFYYNIIDSTFTAADKSEDPDYMRIPAGGQDIIFKLITDIDMSGETGNWTPIGINTSATAATTFRGVFDGGGHTVRDLKNTSLGNNTLRGFFGHIVNATVRNLNMEGCRLEGTGEYYGLVCGYNTNSTIDHCAVLGDEGSHYSYVRGRNAGGICGYNNGGTITHCFNAANVINSGTATQISYIGGITGYGQADNCYNVGNIYGNNANFTGGISGLNPIGNVSNCYNLGYVDGQNAVGSIIGNDFYTNSFNDMQTVPDMTGGDNRLTMEMTGEALRPYLGDEHWVYADSMYPRLKGMDTSDYAVMYAVPFFLYGNQNVNGVRTSFKVGSGACMRKTTTSPSTAWRWRSSRLTPAANRTSGRRTASTTPSRAATRRRS